MSYYKLNTDGTFQSANKQHEGFKPLSELATKEDGSYYTYYNLDGTPDLVAEQEAYLTKLVADGESLVETYIQAKVDALNAELGTKFGNIHNVANYMYSSAYPHALRCKELWEWNERVWMKARAEQANAVTNGLTADEFIAILDAVV